MDAKEAVLARLREAPTQRKKGGGRFSEAARLAYEAAEQKDVEGFERALDAAIRIRLASKGESE